MSSTTLIVYAHGALSTKNSWNYIRQNLINRLTTEQSLNEDELPQEEFIKYNLNREASSEIVDKMVLKISEWIETKAIKKLVVVGHSFGGVLSVHAVRKLSGFLKEKKVKCRIVTMSSPFAGSEIAAVLRMFKPGSLFLLKPRSMFFENIGDHAAFIREFKSLPLPCHTHIFVTVEGGAEWMPQANDGVVTIDSQRFFENDPNASIHEIKANHFEVLLADAVVTQLYKEVK